MNNLLSDLQRRYHDLLNPVSQGFSQIGKAINSNPITKTIVNTAGRSISPVLSDVGNFTNTFSQAPHVDLTSNIQNPILKFGASIPESIINSPRNTAQGIQGLNQQASNMYLKGQLPRLQTLLSNIGKTADLPLNLMGGSLLKATGKNVAEQGFKQVGKQGLLNVMKEGTLEGGKLGTAFGLSGGLQSGENINNPFDYTKNLGMNTAIGTVGGAVLGGLGAGSMYGVNKGVNEINLIKTREALANFHNDIKSGAIANSQNSVYQKYSKALGINNKTENTILQATQRLANKMDDPSAEFVLERSKSLLPPEFRDQPTPEIAKVWSHIIARKNNRSIPGDVPLLTQDLDKAIFKQFNNGGYIRFGAETANSRDAFIKQFKQKMQAEINDYAENSYQMKNRSRGNATYVEKGKLLREYQKNPDKFIEKYKVIPPELNTTNASVGSDALKNKKLKKLETQAPTIEEFVNQSPVLSTKIPSSESVSQPNVAQQPVGDIEKAIPNYKNADEFANNVIKDLQSQTSPLSSVKSFSNQDILDQLNQLGKGKLFNAREALKGSNPTEAQIIEANNKYHESRIQLLKDLYNKTKDYSSPQQPVGVAKVKPQAQIQAEVAGKLKSEPSSLTTSLEGQPLQSQPQLPEAVTTQPLQNQSNSIINPSTTSIQPSVKNDFAAEMDANIGKPLEQRGINVRRKPTPVPLATDESTQNFARGTSGMGSDRMKSDFADYVNQRRATKVEGFIKNKEFSDLNAKGLNGLTEFQANEKTGRFADLKNFFDAKRQEVIDKTGKGFGYKKDYLPQLWANTPEQIQQAFGNRLSKSAPFEMSSVIKDYKTGIDLGLTPKYKTLGDLAGWYESRANKLIADSTYFNKLAKDGMIQPSNKAPLDWVTLNPDRFPKITVDTGEMTYSGAYKAPPELAKMINNYLYDPREAGGFAGGMAKVADYVSNVKNKTLSFGIPGTAINAHGINILARHTLFGTGGNPVSRLLKGGAMLFDQKYSQGVLDSELKTAPRAVKAGLSLSTEVENNLMNETFRKKFGAKWNTAFEKPLFDKMIPALKLSSFNNLVKDGKMSEQDAAKLVNNVYGGINWEQVGRDRNLENFLRTVILAPDWAETNLKMGGNIAKSFVKGGPVAARYRTMATTMLGTYAAMNVANKLTSGHYMYQNDPGHTLEVEAGYTSDGQKRYVRPLGTALDFARLPLDAISSISKGDLTSFSTMIRNRLSIPAGVGIGFLTDTNYRGQAIGYKGKDKYGNDMPLSQRATNIGAEAASLVGVPSFLRQLGSSATGQQGLEQGLTQGFELPLRYVGAGNSKTQKFIGDVTGVKGKDLYDLKKRFQGEAPFSDKQKAMINQGGMPALEAVMNQRIVTRQSNQIKDIQKKAASGEISPEEAQKSMQNILKQPVNTPKQSNAGTNQAYAADNGVFEYNNKYSYISPTGKTTTVDINPPTKGQGIDAFVNTNWNITKAREVWNSQLPQNTKDEIFKKLGVDKTDVRYDALANHTVDVKTQYLQSKSPDHSTLIKNILSGRVESIGGTQFAANGVIDNLVEQGQLSKAEGTALKKIKIDKNGKNLNKATGGKKIKIKKLKAISIKFPSAKKYKKVKLPKITKVKQYKLANVGRITKVKKLKA